jgi:hypothetical protein
MKDLFQFAAALSRTAVLTYSPDCDPSSIVLESVTIARNAMPHHFTARAVILDLQPPQMVKAIAAVEACIREQHPHFVKTGWRAASDGIYLHFAA